MGLQGCLLSSSQKDKKRFTADATICAKHRALLLRTDNLSWWSWPPFSWNCLEDTATLAETRPVTIKDPVWQAGQSFADESPQKVFVRFTQRERDQCIHKTSCVRIRSKRTFLWNSTKCADMHSFNTNNATAFLTHFENVAKNWPETCYNC